MRIWLVDDKSGVAPSALEAVLRRLEERPETGLRLLGCSPFQPDFAEAMRKLSPDLLDVVVVNERAWPEGAYTHDVLNLGLAMVVATAIDRAERFRPLAELHSLLFVPPAPDIDSFWLALVSAFAARRREARWRDQVSHLQQRLDDRIIIERAKGILVERLKISEDEAYQRLRVLSRRQRRQIRDIAQSLLDTQVLFSAEINGFSGYTGEGTERGTENPPHGE